MAGRKGEAAAASQPVTRQCRQMWAPEGQLCGGKRREGGCPCSMCKQRVVILAGQCCRGLRKVNCVVVKSTVWWQGQLCGGKVTCVVARGGWWLSLHHVQLLVPHAVLLQGMYEL